MSKLIDVFEEIEAYSEPSNSQENSNRTYDHRQTLTVLANGPQNRRIDQSPERKHAEWWQEKQDEQEGLTLRCDIPVVQRQHSDHAKEQESRWRSCEPNLIGHAI